MVIWNACLELLEGIQVVDTGETRSQPVEGARNAAAGWHRVHRLAGHPSREVTDGMVRSGKFGRIAMPDERDKFCEVCARAAFTRPPVIHSGSPRTKRIGKRWHADLAGPFKRDRNGVKYVMNVVDDTAGYVYATGLKSKKGRCTWFQKFCELVEATTRYARPHTYDITVTN